MKPPHVVIVGAGFGGLAAAKSLAGKAVDVTLVDRRNHHLFQPLLYQVATAALSPADIAAPIRSIFAHAPNVRVLLGRVSGVDAKAKRVRLSDGASLEYDRLILATGARHSYFGRDEWAEYAPGLKTLEDALAVRTKVLLALERAETETDPDRRRALLTFVVVGGGPTGLEMAGAIAELARQSVSNDFRSITPACSRVVLIEGGGRLLPAFDPELSERARIGAEQLGVEVKLGATLTHVGPGFVEAGGEAIRAHTVVWAAGVDASPAAEWLGVPSDRLGRIPVGGDLRVEGFPDIFAIGDTARCVGPDGRPLPGIAPVAKQQGRHVAATILGRTSGPFRYRDYGQFATIGRHRAVLGIGRLQLSGTLAWLIWCVAHIWFLIGFRSRLVVGLAWLWSYLTFERSARLITGDPAAADARARACLKG